MDVVDFRTLPKLDAGENVIMRLFLIPALAGLALPGCGGDGGGELPSGSRRTDEPVVNDTVRADLPETDSANATVVVRGRVVAAETREPLAGAHVIALHPGVGYREWEAAEDADRLVAGAARTADGGDYWLPGLERGAAYTLMVVTRGYRSAVFDRGLVIRSDDPDTTAVAPIVLEPAMF